METRTKMIGPIKQMVSMTGLNIRGPLKNDQLEIIEDAGIIVQNGRILEIGKFALMNQEGHELHLLSEDYVALPGFIDAHTHLCFAGSRHGDYAARNGGSTYLEIAAKGGGIWSSVEKTRMASREELRDLMSLRINKLMGNGVTTVEIKSGYGLGVEEELKHLEIIQEVAKEVPIDIVSTCLAAHLNPKDFDGSNAVYLSHLVDHLLPTLKERKLTKRVDIFVEESAFLVSEARKYLQKARKLGFELVIHGDQFTSGGALLGVELGVKSVDHLEASGQKDILAIAASEVVANVLPGASLGLGMPFAPARRLLDAGAILGIASDWNPGSAPMGNLLTQAALMGTSEKLTDAEVFSGITFRAARALSLTDRGVLAPTMIADIVAFKANDYREILYHQGELKPSLVWKRGALFGKAAPQILH